MMIPRTLDVDLDVLKHAAPMLDIIGRDTRLKRESQADGGSYAGPCPFCGGKDRFVVRPDGRPSEGRAPSWFCRGCAPKGGSVIDYVIRRQGVDFRAAVDLLARDHGLEAMPAERIAQIRADVTAAAGRETMKRETARRGMEAGWLPRLMDCRVNLEASEAETARLAGGGIGWIARDYFGFGLTTHKGAAALVIPWRSWVGGDDPWRLDAVQLRAIGGEFAGPDGRDRRYEFAPGSRPGIFNDVALQPSMGRDYCVIVEGAKKAAALFNVGEGMVVALASKSAWRSEWA